MTKQEVIQQLEALLKGEDVEHIAAEVETLKSEFGKATGEGGEETDSSDQRFQELLDVFDQHLPKEEEQPEQRQEELMDEAPTEENIVDESAVETHDEPVTEPVAAEENEPEARQAEEITDSEQVQNISAPAEREESTDTATAEEEITDSEQAEQVSAPAETEESAETATAGEEDTATKPAEKKAKQAKPTTRHEVIAQLQELLKHDDVEHIAAEIETLELQFQQLTEEHEHAQMEAFKAEHGDEAAYHPVKDADDLRFKELVNIFNDRHEKYEKQQANKQEESVRARRELIEDIKKLIKEETDISRAFNSFKEIQEKWRAAAPLPIKLYKQLQSEYSHQIDMFFYTIDIYRALKFHDFSKNLEIKKSLVDKMNALLAEPSIRKMESLVKSYQNEWIETGPVPNDQWKELRDEFRKATNAAYDKIQAHYDSLKEQFNKHLEAKNALLEKVKQLGETDADSHKKWQDKTEELIALQKEWKNIGPAQKKDNERIWKEFRAACDTFFTKKKAFYDSRKEEFNSHRDAKLELIRKAEELKSSTEFKKTTEALVQLQSQWKEIGAAGQKDEQKLWNRFRGACNHFFEAKKQFYATLDDRLADNMQLREEHIKKIEAFEPTGNNSADLETLRGFSNDWRNIGHAPRKEADRLNDAYKKALDAKYEALHIGKQEKASIRYQSKVEGLKHSDQTGKLLDNERRFIRDNIKKLEDTIALYENNLSFFGRSKGADALKADVLKKIDQSKEELTTWKDKLKVLQAAK